MRVDNGICTFDCTGRSIEASGGVFGLSESSLSDGYIVNEYGDVVLRVGDEDEDNGNRLISRSEFEELCTYMSDLWRCASESYVRGWCGMLLNEEEVELNRKSAEEMRCGKTLKTEDFVKAIDAGIKFGADSLINSKIDLFSIFESTNMER